MRRAPVLALAAVALLACLLWAVPASRDIVLSAGAPSALSLAEPTPGPVIAHDSFQGTELSGLGEAQPGGPWKVTAAAGERVGVADGTAVLSGLQRGRSVSASLPDVSARDVDVLTTLRLASVSPDYTGLYHATWLRAQADGDHYSVKAMVFTGGRVTLGSSVVRQGVEHRLGADVATGVILHAGERLHVEASVSGTSVATVSARVWVDDHAVPAFQLSVTDADAPISSAGSLGFQDYVSRAGSVTSLSLQDFTARSAAVEAPRPTTATPVPTAVDPVPTTATPVPTVASVQASPVSPTAAPSTEGPVVPAPTGSVETGTATSPAQASVPTPAIGSGATPTTTPTRGGSTAGPATTVAAGLDATGSRVPDSDYPVPSAAVFLSTSGSDGNPGTLSAPVATLNRALDLVPSGGTLVVRGGTYRDWYHDGSTYRVLTKKVTIQAYPHEQVWFDGTDVLPASAWSSAGAGRWTAAHATPSFCDGQYYTLPMTAQSQSPNAGPCAHWDNTGDPSNPLAGDPQMVFVDGAYQHQVASEDQVVPGTFYSDWSGHRLVISADPATSRVEVTARPVMLIAGSGGLTLRGIGVRHYASNEYENLTGAAVYASGSDLLVERTAFVGNAGRALYVNPTHAVVRRSVFVGNGGNGLGANGHSRLGGRDDLLVEQNVFTGNNAELFGTGCSQSCGAADVKLGHLNGFVLRDNIVADAKGPTAVGLWCDLSCDHGVIVDNVVRGNGAQGILYEVSDHGIIASNLVTGNGQDGIRITSADTDVYNNTLLDNRYGVWVYDDRRSPLKGDDSGPDVSGVSVANNLVQAREACLVVFSNAAGAPGTVAGQFFSLLDDNLYVRSGGSTAGSLRWDPAFNGNFGARTTSYSSLGAFTAATGLDAHSSLSTSLPTLRDPASGDVDVVADDHPVVQPGQDVLDALGVTSITAPGALG